MGKGWGQGCYDPHSYYMREGGNVILAYIHMRERNKLMPRN